MAQSVAAAATRTRVNSLDTRLDNIPHHSARARIRVNPPAASPAFLEVIRQAMTDKGLTQKSLAITADVAESAVSDALKGMNGRSFSVEWLWAQDDAFVLYVFELAQKQRGFTTDGIRAVKIARIKELLGLILEVA